VEAFEILVLLQDEYKEQAIQHSYNFITLRN